MIYTLAAFQERGALPSWYLFIFCISFLNPVQVFVMAAISKFVVFSGDMPGDQCKPSFDMLGDAMDGLFDLFSLGT